MGQPPLFEGLRWLAMGNSQPKYHKSGLTHEQVEEFRESFDIFDTDGSGEIDAPELRELLRAFGQNATDEEVQKMIDEVDIDKTGTITFDEFVVMIVLRMEDAMMSDQAQVRQAFDVFDMDKTGLITTTELQRALNKRVNGGYITAKEADDMIKAADKDGDGAVDFEEFVA